MHGLFVQNSPFTGLIERTMRGFKQKILNTEIKITSWELHTVEKDINRLIETLRNSDASILQEFIERMERGEKVHIRMLNARHEKKIASLRVPINTMIKSNEEWIVNLSDNIIPPEVSHFLSLGSKMGLPYKRKDHIPTAHILSQIEDIVGGMDIPVDERNRARSNIARCISNYMHRKEPKSPLSNWLSHTTKTTKEFLKNNSDLMVTNADKGNKTVVLKKCDYESKMEALITDTNTYRVLKKDPTVSFQNKNNEIVNRIYRGEHIDERTKKDMITYKAIPPRIYGLPKIHKENVPLRPIVSCIGSPTHKLSRFCNDILKNIADRSPYKLQNSYDFVKRIDTVKVDADDVMISFDVVSLFTNIPRDLALLIIEEEWDRIEVYTSIPKSLFKDIVMLIMKSGFFKYKGSFYEQIEGMPMGNCLSPVIADIVIDRVIDTAIRAATIPPKVIYKYVDDLFLITHKDNVSHLLDTFNDVHEKIKFTCELEKEGKLPYLDTLVQRRTDGSLVTDWYQKDMASGRILNFHSTHPLTQKINTADGLVHRVNNLTTNPLTDTGSIVTNILKKNSYPDHTITKLLRKRELHSTDDSSNSTISTTTKKFFSLTYINGLSERIKKIVGGFSSNVSISFKSQNTLARMYTNLKDSIPAKDRSNVIYSIPCECGKIYIGRTSQKLDSRIKQHKLSVKDFSKEATSLVQHMREEQHRFNFDSTDILDCSRRAHHLNVMEMYYIQKHERECVNNRAEGSALSSWYSPLIWNQ